MFERPAIGERAILVHMDMYDESHREYLDEFRELAASAGANVIAVITSRRSSPDSKYFIGRGKVEEIAALVKAEKAELVLFNHSLSPSQERNLEKVFECRVLDRTGLILDIFAQRARSHEGKLQVELAQLRHMSTRLIRGWTHLERQRGGIGMMGPGETQLETDRRLLGVRIKQINKRLTKVRQQREQNRQARRKAEVLTVSLVGYTNAGKSTLFNALTASSVYAEDKLFATLDPTLRKLQLANGQTLVLADTVGFIRHLPHDLVEAFRSTLQETEEAHLLLHVIDAADDMRQDNIHAVETVLKEIGADDVPRIDIMNKIDCMDVQPAIERDESGRAVRIWVSAQTGAGMDLIRDVLVEYFSQDQVRGEICLTPEQARMRALLYGLGAVQSERNDESGNVWLAINMPRRDWLQLVSREHINVSQLLLNQSMAHSLQ
ncbi:MAG TPA: ribosome rescue GTPase HflX [Gammaproteobacteria bacterium]|nr:ribosome rescue GTPase HflX [Gammaproteobacteria bacterium]